MTYYKYINFVWGALSQTVMMLTTNNKALKTLFALVWK